MLRLPGLPEAVVEEGHPVDGFVAVEIVVVVAVAPGRLAEEVVQFRKGAVAAAEHSGEGVQVVRDEPALLEQVALAGTVKPAGLPVGHDFPPIALFVLGEEPIQLRMEPFFPNVAAGEHLVRDVAFSHVGGDLGGTPVEIGVLQDIGDDDQVILVDGKALVRQLRGTDGALQGLLAVVMAQTLGPGVGQNRIGRVAQHAASVGIEHFPAVEIAFPALFGQGDLRLDQVFHQARVEDRLQRDMAAEGVPAGEQGPPGIALGCPDGAVSRRETAVHVREDPGIDSGVEHRRIEDMLLVLGPAGNADLAEFLLPGLSRIGVEGGEVLAGRLGLIVLAGAFGIDEGEGDLHLDLFAFGRREFGKEADAVAVEGISFPDDLRIRTTLHVPHAVDLVVVALHPVWHGGFPAAPVLHGPAERRVEIQVVINVGPAVAPATLKGRVFHVADEGAVIQDFDFLPGGGSGDAERQVALDAGAFILREGEAKGSAVGRRRTLGPDAGFLQGAGIIAGRGFHVPEGGPVTGELAVRQAVAGLDRAVGGHREQVAEFGPPAGSAGVHEGETRNRRVMGAVAGAGVVDVARDRAEVDHAEGCQGAGGTTGAGVGHEVLDGVPEVAVGVAAGGDERVGVVQRLDPRRLAADRKGEDREDKQGPEPYRLCHPRHHKREGPIAVRWEGPRSGGGLVSAVACPGE